MPVTVFSKKTEKRIIVIEIIELKQSETMRIQRLEYVDITVLDVSHDKIYLSVKGDASSVRINFKKQWKSENVSIM